ncbi:MATE family efflux transporter [Candidatus Fermentibacteria bacterium]|nr:MATE family efflux transporter [Candidatus Fermentibacteria bacterium]
MSGRAGGIDLTSGPLGGGIARVAWPLMLSSLLQTLYNLADTYWLGKLGRTALVAPTVTMNVVFVAMSLGMGLSVGGTALVSQYRGAGNLRMMRRSGGQTMMLMEMGAVLISVTAIVLARPVLGLLGTPADSFAYTLSYFRIIAAGLPFMFGFFAYRAIFTGIGHTVRPLRVNLIAVLVNVILDPVLIFGLGPFPRMEVAGAALATCIARALATALGLADMFSIRGGFGLKARHLVPHGPTIAKVFRVGLPVGLGRSGTSLGFTVLIGIVNSFGSAVTAAFGIANRIVHMAVIPGHGLAQATGASVGQNLGAGATQRASRTVRLALGMILSFFLPATILMFLFGADISKIFIDDPQVISHGREVFRFVSPSVLVFGVFMVLTGAFQGSGHTLPVMVLNMSRLWLVRLPGALLFARALGMGPSGIWLAMLVSNTVTAAAAAVWFSRGTWKRAVIERAERGGRAGLPKEPAT